MQEKPFGSLHSRSSESTLETAAEHRRGAERSTFLSVIRERTQGILSPLVAALLAVILIGITLYVAWMVRHSSRESMRVSLETVLAANVKALELWLDEERDAAEQIAADEDLRQAAIAMLESSRIDSSAAGEPLATSVRRDLQTLTERARIDGYAGWLLIDPNWTIIDSSDRRLVGRAFAEGDLDDSGLGTSAATVTTPIRLPAGLTDGDLVDDAQATLPETAMLSIAPLREDLQTRGWIALMIDPAAQFSDILSVARMGQSGETYAFNRDAVMLSQSRFAAQLRRAGLLGRRQDTPLNVHLRDPGRRLDGPLDGRDDHRRWPLTEMADAATRGGSGTDVAGYRGYRGVSVVGTWRWLPDYGFGVATELETEEAYAPLKILGNAFFALLSMTTLAGVTLLGLAWATRRKLVREVRRVPLARRLGQYELQRPIGRGGMGTVYRGTHRLLDRAVAVKVLENTDVNERSLARFQREVRLSARLMHPNTIEIYDFGKTDDGTFFYVMEFVDGISLEQLIDHYGRQPAERVIYLLLQVCGSIAEAHQSGMVHRDLKPANVLVTSRSGVHDLVKVLDFGLAKQLDQESMQLTRTDGLTGTPLYMSPESIRDASAADERSDLYAIGAIGYSLLCGAPPFEGDSAADVCAMKLHHPLPESPDRRLGVPLAADLQGVLLRCLSRDPQARPSSARQLAVDLMSCRDSPHWTQQDAALWWREVFDGPYPDDFDVNESQRSADGTRGDTAVNRDPPAVRRAAQSTVN